MTSITHSLAPVAAFTVALSSFSVSRLGSTTTALTPACFIRARYVGRTNALAFVPISTPQSWGCSLPAWPAATLACAAAGHSATASTPASAQSARRPPERLGSGLAAPDQVGRGAVALRCRKLASAAVGAAPTMTPYESAVAVGSVSLARVRRPRRVADDAALSPGYARGVYVDVVAVSRRLVPAA
jgi:hypothetical protein